MELSEEERRRIYLEEKAKLDLFKKETIARKNTKIIKLFAWLIILIVFVAVVFAIILLSKIP